VSSAQYVSKYVLVSDLFNWPSHIGITASAMPTRSRVCTDVHYVFIMSSRVCSMIYHLQTKSLIDKNAVKNAKIFQLRTKIFVLKYCKIVQRPKYFSALSQYNLFIKRNYFASCKNRN
jgi:hypothetical protein